MSRYPDPPLSTTGFVVVGISGVLAAVVAIWTGRMLTVSCYDAWRVRQAEQVPARVLVSALFPLFFGSVAILAVVGLWRQWREARS